MRGECERAGLRGWRLRGRQCPQPEIWARVERPDALAGTIGNSITPGGGSASAAGHLLETRPLPRQRSVPQEIKKLPEVTLSQGGRGLRTCSGSDWTVSCATSLSPGGPVLMFSHRLVDETIVGILADRHRSAVRRNVRARSPCRLIHVAVSRQDQQAAQNQESRNFPVPDLRQLIRVDEAGEYAIRTKRSRSLFSTANGPSFVPGFFRFNSAAPGAIQHNAPPRITPITAASNLAHAPSFTTSRSAGSNRSCRTAASVPIGRPSLCQAAAVTCRTGISPRRNRRA